MQEEFDKRVENRIFIKKRIIYSIFLLAINLLLVLNRIPICSDTNSYLTHPGYEFEFGSADAFLYGLLFIIKNNIIWYKSIQICSVIFFQLTLYFLPISSRRLILGSTIPWLFSILGIHFWSCGIRNAVSFSFLLLAFSLRFTSKFNTQKYLKYLLILIFIFLSFLTHWSTAIIAPFIIFPGIINLTINSTKKLLLNLRLNKKFFIISIILILLAIFFVFVSDYGKILSYGLLAKRKAYGTLFPYVMLLNLSIFYITSKNLLLNSKIVFSFFISILICSIIPILGFNPLIIRYTLQLWVLFLLSLLIYTNNFKSVILYYFLSSPAFIIYLLQNYPKYYLN